MDVKLIARPKNPLNVITNQKLGNLRSGLSIEIQNIYENQEKRVKGFSSHQD